MEELEKRIARLEETVKKIIALPQLSKLAGRDAEILQNRILGLIVEKEELLKSPKLTDERRKELEEQISRYHRQIAPALSLEPYGSSTEAIQRGQAVHEES